MIEIAVDNTCRENLIIFLLSPNMFMPSLL
jgi:hypothetical protein